MVTQRSGPQGKPGEKWLRDLTPDNATAPAPDPTSDRPGVREQPSAVHEGRAGPGRDVP
jgi:hypothetical protein